MKATDFPRPASDNGWGVHGDANVHSQHWDEDIGHLERMGMKWVKVLADGPNQVDLCKRLLQKGIFPIVRLWRDKPNPGTLPDRDRVAVNLYVAAGVKYFEVNNEPNLSCEWRGGLPPFDDAVAQVAASFQSDAEFILSKGAHPLFPAMAPTHANDPDTAYPMNPMLLACMRKLGHELFQRGALFAVHNAGFNHDLDGQDVLADPCWWNSWRAPMLYAQSLWKMPVGVIATEGGFWLGHWDATYPVNDISRVVALYQKAYERMLGEDPYFIAVCPWLLRDSTGAHRAEDCWVGTLKPVMDMVASLPKTVRTLSSVERPEDIPLFWDSPNHGSRFGQRPTHIVLHDTEGSLRATYHWFMNPKGASAHVVVDRDGLAYRAVADDRTAWGAGYAVIPGYNWAAKTDPYPSPNANRVTLHLEMIAPAYPAPAEYTQEQLDTVADIVRTWMVKYGIPLERVVCHKDIDGYGRRTDPRDWDHGAFVRKVLGEDSRWMEKIETIVCEWRDSLRS